MIAPSRRGFLSALAGGGALLALAACGASGSADPGGEARASGSAQGGGAFEFTDDRGKKVSLPAKPTRIVAQSAAAAALWDFGVRPIAVFGPHKLKDGGPDPEVGNVDISTVESLGNVWGEFNVEKYASLRPELLVSGMYLDDQLWYVPEKSKDKIEALAPTIGIRLTGKPLEQIIGKYEELARALGADTDAPEVAQAKERFEAAAAKLSELAKKGLKIMAMSGLPENMYVVAPKDHAAMDFVRGKGLDVVVPEKPDEGGFYETLSWENADKYPADVILYDARAQSMKLEEMMKKPTFADLPAVKAGQVYPWRAEERFSYLGHANMLEELIANLEKAKPGIA